MVTKKTKKNLKNELRTCTKKKDVVEKKVKPCTKKKDVVEKKVKVGSIKVEPIKAGHKVESVKTGHKIESVKAGHKVECCATKQEINNSSYVLIDYPVENDIINGSAYVLRIGASHDFNAYVEVSFNNGEWNLCRFASGYWWYDWAYFQPGQFTVRARIVSAGDGKVIKMSDVKHFKVV